jgi:DNA polymerase elongation subunit (family B)
MPRSPGAYFREPRRGSKANVISANAGFDLFEDSQDNDKRLNTTIADASDFIVDMREWDVPYHVRVLIDKGNSNDCHWCSR